MSQDSQTYQRAVFAALWGFGVQAIVAGVLLLLGLWLGSELVIAATYHAFGGLGIWLILALIYQQHKLERIESLEADELRQSHGADSSIFETTAEDLSIARRRLRRLTRWGLPLVALGTAAYLIGVGIWLIVDNQSLLAAKALVRDTLDVDPLQQQIAGGEALVRPGFVLAFVVGLWFVTFVFSRYVAGMANVREWSLLRGGAGYLMGSSLVCVALAIGYALLFLPTIAVLKYLTVIIPGFMVLIGLEILVNQLLDIYRPRKAGEMAKAAFDSKLLSLLTAPESIAKTINEAINYQFGFEITHSWFWQLFSKAFGWLILLGAVVLLAVSTLVIVEPHEKAIVLRFGQIVGQPLEPGMHLKLPWPADRVKRYDVTLVKQFQIGSGTELKPFEPILWTNEHTTEKPTHLIVAPPSDLIDLTESTEAEQIDPALAAGRTPSVSLVNVEAMVQYRVADVMAYATTNANPDQRLKDIAETQLSRLLLSRDLDQWVGKGRTQGGHELAERVQREADAENLGIEVVALAIASVHPPQPVADAFHLTVTAEQQREIEIENAQRDAIEALAEVAGTTVRAQSIADQIVQLQRMRAAGADPAKLAEKEAAIEELLLAADGNAAAEIAQARADRWQTENTERSAALMYAEELKAYKAAPRFYKMRLYLDALTDGFNETRKYLLIADRDNLTVRFNLEEFDTGFDNLDLRSDN